MKKCFHKNKNQLRTYVGTPWRHARHKYKIFEFLESIQNPSYRSWCVKRRAVYSLLVILVRSLTEGGSYLKKNSIFGMTRFLFYQGLFKKQGKSMTILN